MYRRLKWGRTLARHGALRGIEGAAETPPGVERLCRIARFGTIQPKIPDYAAAFQAIGPAAVKLGQTLATRPDLRSEEHTSELQSLMRISYAVFCLKKKNKKSKLPITQTTISSKHDSQETVVYISRHKTNQ